jgi:uncharacterized membrane protein
MRLLYLVSVWLHIIAATIWIGGLFFIVLVVVPWLRQGGRSHSANTGRFLMETGTRFRFVGWACFCALATTGGFNLWVRGVGPGELTSLAWWTTPFGTAVGLKLLAFSLVLVASFAHDFGVGPGATQAMSSDPGSEAASKLRRQASFLGRLNGILALVLVALGVIMVRGWPW